VGVSTPFDSGCERNKEKHEVVKIIGKASMTIDLHVGWKRTKVKVKYGRSCTKALLLSN
jgi:hypothetical protein